MPSAPQRGERTVNVTIAWILEKRNPQWNVVHSEKTQLLVQPGKQPDIYIDHARGEPIIVETEWKSNSPKSVQDDALARIGAVLKESGKAITRAVAVRLPDSLREVANRNLQAQLDREEFEYAIYSLAPGRDPGGADRFPTAGWLRGDLNSMGRAIDLCLLSEDLVKNTLDTLITSVESAARILEDRQAGAIQGIADTLKQGDGEQTRQMAMTIVCNAMVFHEVIAGSEFLDNEGKPLRPVAPLSAMVDHHRGPIDKDKLIQEWSYIVDEINYWPIFEIAKDILNPINDKAAEDILKTLKRAAKELSRVGITNVHDLAGSMFQQLIAARRLLATFYTLPESAMLLAELAVSRLDINWKDPDACRQIKIGDFACGTGTLLSAAYQSILARIRASAHDDMEMHKAMMENAIWGADVLPAAAHLATSQLASAHPKVLFNDANIHTLRLGHEHRAGLLLGALELINSSTILTLFGKAGRTAGGKKTGEGKTNIAFPAGKTDLVIMNPPYVKADANDQEQSSYPQFAAFGASDNEKEAMRLRLKTFRRSSGRGSGRGKSTEPSMNAGNDKAGMGSHFIDVAHAMVRLGGHVALVLPATSLLGSSWRNARELLSRFYRDIVIVTVIRGGGGSDGNFSSDTNMAECLLIARRLRRGESGPPGDAMYVNLERLPGTQAEAFHVARAIITAAQGSGQYAPLKLGEAPIGVWLRAREGVLNGGGYARVRSAMVADVCKSMIQGTLRLPQTGDVENVPLCRLDDLGCKGPSHLKIGYRSDSKSKKKGGVFVMHPGADGAEYPALWENNKDKPVRYLTASPNRHGIPRAGKNDEALALWKDYASTLHFNQDFRLNSESLAACFSSEKTLGGRAWPGFIPHDQRHIHPLLLWANTTLGVMAFWWHGTRQHLGRATVTLTRLPRLPAIDARRLSPAQLEQCTAIFQKFCGRAFLQAYRAWEDETRRDLDKAMLVDVLGLDCALLEPLDKLRHAWCTEWTVRGDKPGP